MACPGVSASFENAETMVRSVAEAFISGFVREFSAAGVKSVSLRAMTLRYRVDTLLFAGSPAARDDLVATGFEPLVRVGPLRALCSLAVASHTLLESGVELGARGWRSVAHTLAKGARPTASRQISFHARAIGCDGAGGQHWLLSLHGLGERLPPHPRASIPQPHLHLHLHLH